MVYMRSFSTSVFLHHEIYNLEYPTIYQKGFKQSKPSTSTNWQCQIPQKEIDANPRMKQNPAASL